MSNISCSICYDNILHDRPLSHLTCGHIFHKNCLDEWLERSKTCPECRKRASKPTRVFPNFATTTFDGFSGLDTQKAIELDGKDGNIELQIKEFSQQLAKKEADFIAYKKSMTFISESKSKLIGDLRIDIVNLEKRNKITEWDLIIEKDVVKTAVAENLVLHDKLKELETELNNTRIDLNGRNKLIECYERANCELEKKLNDLQIKSKCLRKRVRSLKSSTRHRNTCKKMRAKKAEPTLEQKAINWFG